MSQQIEENQRNMQELLDEQMDNENRIEALEGELERADFNQEN